MIAKTNKIHIIFVLILIFFFGPPYFCKISFIHSGVDLLMPRRKHLTWTMLKKGKKNICFCYLRKKKKAVRILFWVWMNRFQLYIAPTYKHTHTHTPIRFETKEAGNFFFFWTFLPLYHHPPFFFTAIVVKSMWYI